MACSAENVDNGHPTVAEYGAKFPEIPQNVLMKIVQEHGADPDICQRILERESKKCLYGSSPSPEPVSPRKGFSPAHLISDIEFNRSNSTGSASSSHSSGRSTPVNPIAVPTPWMVPKVHSSPNDGQPAVATPLQNLPNNSIPSGMVYSTVDGKYYYQPWSSANALVPVGTPVNIAGAPVNLTSYASVPSGQQTLPGESRCPPLHSNSPGGFTSPITTTNKINQTSPSTLASTSRTSLTSGHSPLTNSASGLPIRYMYYHPDNTSDRTSPSTLNSNAGHLDSSLLSNVSYVSAAPVLPNFMNTSTKNESPATVSGPGFVPIHPFSSVSRHVLESPYGTLVGSPGNSPYSVGSTAGHFDARQQTLPANVPYLPASLFLSSSGGTALNGGTQNLMTNTGYVPVNVSRQNMETANVSTSGEAHMMHGSASRQSSSEKLTPPGLTVENDAYLKACLSQQWKRFLNLQKEFDVEKERLEILIREITDRDDDLYNRRYRVAPNPTLEQIQALQKENEQLQRAIDEISKNIDRLDNGQAVLHSADPRLHNTHRFSPSHRPKDHYDRSNSVPCLPGALEHGRPKPPLNRPLSEHDLNINMEQRSVQYRITPPPEAIGLPEWNLVNREVAPPQPAPDTRPVNSDEGEQWSCSKCTFLNHESLHSCEMCNANR